MNEFIEQFLIEARELVEQATGDLLALEGRPDDGERLDSAFRAFHTLKGAAGIVDFAAMSRALHAAEEVLSEIRGSGDPVTPALIGDLLSSLDQVLDWLDAIEASGAPPADAEASADRIVGRFRPVAADVAPPGPATSPTGLAATAWLAALTAAFPDAAGRAQTAVAYRPDESAFFRGEDPLALIEGLPGAIGVRIAPVAAWPPLDLLDPFACGVELTALTTEAPGQVADHLHAVLDQVTIVELPRRASDLPPVHRDVIEAQIRMLAAAGDEGLAGRLESAARVADYVLRRSARHEAADGIERVLPRSIRDGNKAPLVEALHAALSPKPAAGGAEPERIEAEEGEYREIEPGETGAKEIDARETGPGEAGSGEAGSGEAGSGEAGQNAAGQASHEAVARALRVDVERIDALVRLAGELTVVKNAAGHVAGLAATGTDVKTLEPLLRDNSAALDRLVGELQHAVLGIRVLPLRQLFQRFRRLVRELGTSLGKPVRLITEGEDTEADKAVVEGLFEPLLHVVRNAVDHGLERPADRAAAGKPPTGTIAMRAVRRGEHVEIEVEDDGAGVDLARVREVAATRGVASSEELAGMTEDEILDLVFSPGFSTAQDVTDVSGRGVGMDAVRAAVARMGGRVTIDSRTGRGTTVRLVLPFTVMITRVMTVEAGAQVFGLPLEAVLETVRLDRDAVRPVGGARAVVLRNRVVPLFDLGAVLGSGIPVGGTAAAKADGATVVVAKVAEQVVGIEVDRVGGRMEVMLKPVDGLLADVPGISGVTLLGDGRVLIVLDVQELLS